MHHFVLLYLVSPFTKHSSSWVACQSSLELVPPIPKLSEALHVCGVLKGVLLSWFTLGMAFSGCVAVIWCL